jgi:prevent-host-death family protein
MNIKTLPITEARKRIFELAEDVQVPGSSYVLTERGRSKVVLVSADEYDSWMETIEVVRAFPDLEKDIAKAESEYKRGEYVIFNEKPVSNHPAKKRAKRSRKH